MIFPDPIPLQRVIFGAHNKETCLFSSVVIGLLVLLQSEAVISSRNNILKQSTKHITTPNISNIKDHPYPRL